MLLSGCSAGSRSESAEPYAAEFEQAIANADSDYVRQALSDGRVTPAELQDARQHVLGCLQQVGIPATYETDEYGQTGLVMVGELSSAQQAAELSCGRQWMGAIEELFNKTTSNPRNEDWNALVAACLVRKGLAPNGFTARDYRELTDREAVRVDSSTMTPNENGISSWSTTEESPVVTLPGGARMDQPEAIRCEIDPSA